MAEVAYELGLYTILVTGPTYLRLSKQIERYDVVSAQEMFEKVKQLYQDVDIVIMSAAVSDYKPKVYSNQKIKKHNHNLLVELEKNIDILKYLGENKKSQFLVGYALETENEIVNAMKKLENKNLDLIILNSPNQKNTGFSVDTNTIKIFDKYGLLFSSSNKLKKEISEDIFRIIEQKLK